MVGGGVPTGGQASPRSWEWGAAPSCVLGDLLPVDATPAPDPHPDSHLLPCPPHKGSALCPSARTSLGGAAGGPSSAWTVLSLSPVLPVPTCSAPGPSPGPSPGRPSAWPGRGLSRAPVALPAALTPPPRPPDTAPLSGRPVPGPCVSTYMGTTHTPQTPTLRGLPHVHAVAYWPSGLLLTHC